MNRNALLNKKFRVKLDLTNLTGRKSVIGEIHFKEYHLILKLDKKEKSNQFQKKDFNSIIINPLYSDDKDLYFS